MIYEEIIAVFAKQNCLPKGLDLQCGHGGAGGGEGTGSNLQVECFRDFSRGAVYGYGNISVGFLLCLQSAMHCIFFDWEKIYVKMIEKIFLFCTIDGEPGIRRTRRLLNDCFIRKSNNSHC